jgi:predicted HTH domain antitoxin
MIKLEENQHILIKEYQELLVTVEEALEYIVASFDNLEMTEGDRLLLDVFQALPHISSTSEQLSRLFEKESPALEGALASFHEVAERAAMLEGNFGNLEKKQEIIREQLYPVYTGWSQRVQQELASYTQS